MNFGKLIEIASDFWFSLIMAIASLVISCLGFVNWNSTTASMGVLFAIIFGIRAALSFPAFKLNREIKNGQKPQKDKNAPNK